MKNIEVRKMSQSDLEQVSGGCKWCVVIDVAAEIAKEAVHELLK